jgi:hypothetical protein
MQFRTLVAAALVCAASLPLVAAEPIPASLGAPPPTLSAQLMARFGLEGLFSRFGQSLAASPRQQGVGDERFLGAWEAAAAITFDAPELDARLGRSVSQALDPGEVDWLDGFSASALGARIAGLEATTQEVAPGAQIGVVAKGQILYLALPEPRRGQLGELMELTGTEIMSDLMAESLRGMAMGLRLAAAGDLEVPWSEIDADVSRQLSGMKSSLADATRAVLAYTYASLSDDELEAYLQFLRAPATRKFYGAATLAIGDILRETMFGLGETVAQRLHRVNV